MASVPINSVDGVVDGGGPEVAEVAVGNGNVTMAELMADYANVDLRIGEGARESVTESVGVDPAFSAGAVGILLDDLPNVGAAYSAACDATEEVVGSQSPAGLHPVADGLGLAGWESDSPALSTFPTSNQERPLIEVQITGPKIEGFGAAEAGIEVDRE